MIYLDHHRQTPLRVGVLAAMHEAARRGGNASSLHALGRAARRDLQAARSALKVLVGGANADVIFCGSLQEAQTLAAYGLARAAAASNGRRRRVLFDAATQTMAPQLSRYMAQAGFVVDVCGPDGRPQNNCLLPSAREMPPPTVSVAPPAEAVAAAFMQYVVPTVPPPVADGGSAYPAPAPAMRLGQQGVPVILDASLAAGRVPLEFDASGAAAMVVDGAPLGGPPGVAAIVLKPGWHIEPLWGGGGQQAGMRPGSEAVPLVRGLGVAASTAAAERAEIMRRTRQLRGALAQGWVARLGPGGQAEDWRASGWLEPGRPDLGCGLWLAPHLDDLALWACRADEVAPALAALKAHGVLAGWGFGAVEGVAWEQSAAAHAATHYVALALGWTTQLSDVAVARRALTDLFGDPKT